LTSAGNGNRLSERGNPRSTSSGENGDAGPDAGGPAPATAVCPYLGLLTDSQSHLHVLSPIHRCYRTDPPLSPSAQHQTVFCLTSRFSGCSRFHGPIPASLLRQRLRSGDWLTIIAMAATILAGAVVCVIVVGNPFGVEPEQLARAGAVPPTPVLAATTASDPGPSGAPAAATASASLTRAVTPSAPGISSPLASPTPQLGVIAAPGVPIVVQYTVQPGDSLTSLARRFNVSVAALAAQNKLPATAGLRIGQRLQVPVGAFGGSTPPAR